MSCECEGGKYFFGVSFIMDCVHRTTLSSPAAPRCHIICRCTIGSMRERGKCGELENRMGQIIPRHAFTECNISYVSNCKRCSTSSKNELAMMSPPSSPLELLFTGTTTKRRQRTTMDSKRTKNVDVCRLNPKEYSPKVLASIIRNIKQFLSYLRLTQHLSTKNS